MLSLLLSALFMSAPSLIAPHVPTIVPPGTVEVSVTGARDNEGQVVALLFASSEGFPADTRKAAYTASAPIRNGSASLQIPNVRAGRYSIVVFHDADANGKIRRNLLGMPREGIGVTRFDGGRPSFRSTAVDIAATGGQFSIALNYR